MPTPAFKLRPYLSDFTAVLVPSENATISGLNIGPKLSYISGNSVLIVNTQYPSNRFEAIVTTYDQTTGILAIEQVTNIRGMSFGGPKLYTINVCGERGTNILTGSGIPSSTIGRPGDIYINTNSGDMLIKS